jgi:hypothetical protein
VIGAAITPVPAGDSGLNQFLKTKNGRFLMESAVFILKSLAKLGR